jgi:hypothetical protein
MPTGKESIMTHGFKFSSIEEYEEHYKLSEQQTLHRQKTKELFPYGIIVKGFYPEHDNAGRWCWQQFGPCHTFGVNKFMHRCYEHSSEYPACPLVLAAEEIIEGEDSEGNKYRETTYKDPGEHTHTGIWTMFWVGKTGYDYGIGEFCFTNEADAERFRIHVPDVTLGEKYNE